MLKKYYNWYNNLKPFKKFTVSFFLNWLYWFVAWLIAEEFIYEEKRSLKYQFFHATWMSIIMTIPFSWKALKQIFKPEKNNINDSSN